jgi:hypothetical protein
VNVTGALVPLVVVTVTLCGPAVAVGEISNLVVSCVELVTLTGPTVTSVPPLTTTVVAPMTKFVPVIKTVLIVIPASPLFGESCVTVGGPMVTVNVTGVFALVPFGVVTVTVRGPVVAPAPIVKLVVN